MASHKVTLRAACEDDAAGLFEIVNAAYAVELGDSGRAFKRNNRYNTVDEILHDIREADDGSFITAELSENAGDGTAEGGAEEKLVGCVRSQVDLSQLRGNFGPFAVHPSAQGHGVGTALLDAVHERCRTAGCTHVQIEVVNHRTDLIPYYTARGYQQVGTAPCDAAHNCDESQITRPSHFILLRRDL